MTPPASLRVLLAGLVDYAGLFPPAACSMEQAAAAYAAYRRSADRWALGRFVSPVVRLDELAAAARVDQEPWGLSALTSADIPSDARAIARFAAVHGERLVVDAVECRASDPAAITAACESLAPLEASVYVEIPVGADPAPLLDAIAAGGARAKIRTGGVTTDAFPSAPDVARFIVRCVERRLAFKATAGLHHPLRGDFALTYEAGAASGMMFGFLNVFLAAGRAADGAPGAEIESLLVMSDAAAVRFHEDRVELPGGALSLDAVTRLRERVALSVGSCSFTEPLDDLRRLAFL